MTPKQIVDANAAAYARGLAAGQNLTLALVRAEADRLRHENKDIVGANLLENAVTKLQAEMLAGAALLKNVVTTLREEIR